MYLKTDVLGGRGLSLLPSTPIFSSPQLAAACTVEYNEDSSFPFWEQWEFLDAVQIGPVNRGAPMGAEPAHVGVGACMHINLIEAFLSTLI